MFHIITGILLIIFSVLFLIKTIRDYQKMNRRIELSKSKNKAMQLATDKLISEFKSRSKS